MTLLLLLSLALAEPAPNPPPDLGADVAAWHALGARWARPSDEALLAYIHAYPDSPYARLAATALGDSPDLDALSAAEPALAPLLSTPLDPAPAPQAWFTAPLSPEGQPQPQRGSPLRFALHLGPLADLQQQGAALGASASYGLLGLTLRAGMSTTGPQGMLGLRASTRGDGPLAELWLQSDKALGLAAGWRWVLTKRTWIEPSIGARVFSERLSPLARVELVWRFAEPEAKRLQLKQPSSP